MAADVKTEDGDTPKRAKAFTIKYKRPRGSRACAVCRSRKVRCDAEMHIPCTNCITFGCECVLPEAKRRGHSKRKEVERTSASTSTPSAQTPSVPSPSHKYSSPLLDHSAVNNDAILNISQVSVPPSLSSEYHHEVTHGKRKREDSDNDDDTPTQPLSSNSYRGKTALTFLGATSVGSVARQPGENHVTLTDDVLLKSVGSATNLDSVELEILKLRGAFLLPSRELAADLINSYFEHVHPLMPVINRTDFMRRFNDPDDSPSLMLMQAVLLLGCRVSKNPAILDSKGSNDLVSLTLFRRAKALYETSYESDPVSIVQTLILIGSYWEGPEDVTKNSFYWTRVAVGLAQGFGFHRDVSNNNRLTATEKKIWRRIWWCLFEKDRNVAIAFGRPSVIDLNDCDVPMLTLDDFNEDEDDYPSPYPVNETQALYFIHLVKLAEITGIIIKHQYSVKSAQLKRKNKFSIIQHCDMLMGIWFTNLPKQLVFNLNDPESQSFWCCLLNAQYYNRLFLIHRSNLVRMAQMSSSNPNNYKYPSWGISFQAARMISIVSKILLDSDQIRYVPVMYIYIAFSALMMLIYHVDSTNQVIASTASDSLYVSRAVLRELAKYWPIARVLMNLFDKYADDKFKRRKLIDHNVSAEISAERRGGNYDEEDAGPPLGPQSVSPTSMSPDPAHHNPYRSSVYEEPKPNEDFASLVQQIKPQVSSESDPSGPQRKSPTSSTQSFPDISLVTETVPSNPNFFENFEPTQLFPDIRVSMPSTTDHSPAHMDDQGEANVIGSNVYSGGTGGEAINNPATPTAGSSMPNFVDQQFLNMNLQSGMGEASGLDEMSNLFNFQY